MSKTVTIQANQSLFDIAIQETGTIKTSKKIAAFNDISVTEMLVPGTILTLPEDLSKNIEVANYFFTKNITPATETSTTIARISNRGIGEMKIGSTFKIR